jgi:Do/DeqQ family serine protease
VAKQLLPTVVYIKITSRVADMHLGIPGFMGIPMDEFHKGLEELTSSGSGFIIDQEGYILTNSHVIESALSISVVLSDGREFDAELIGSDPETDVALIKIDESFEEDHVAILGQSVSVEVGEWAIAIGNPLGLEQSLTVGVISATGRRNLDIAGGAPIFQNFIQTDASINLGNSGGPLVNIRGEVIGVNTAVNSHGQGLGFAIPVDMAKRVVTDLRSRGTVSRGYLGMVPRALEDDLCEALDLPAGSNGVFVDSVQEGMPADRGGLMPSDVILEWQGVPLKDVQDFRLRVADALPGSKQKALILRSGKRKSLTFTLGDRSVSLSQPLEMIPRNVEPESDPESEPHWLGLGIADLDTREFAHLLPEVGNLPAKGGALVVSIERHSPAAEKLTTGDIITRIDRFRVSNLDDYRRALAELQEREKAVLIHILRAGRATVVAVKP